MSTWQDEYDLCGVDGRLRDFAEAVQAACERAVQAELHVLKHQRDDLRAALVKVLETHEREAKASMSYQNARENFSDSVDERKAHERAMLAASDAEREARVLLLTLRNKP